MDGQNIYVHTSDMKVNQIYLVKTICGAFAVYKVHRLFNSIWMINSYNVYEIFLLRFPQSGEKCKTGDVDGRLLVEHIYMFFLCNEEITNDVDDAISVRATFNFSSESRSSCNGFLKSENTMDDGMQKL